MFAVKNQQIRLITSAIMVDCVVKKNPKWQPTTYFFRNLAQEKVSISRLPKIDLLVTRFLTFCLVGAYFPIEMSATQYANLFQLLTKITHDKIMNDDL